MVESSTVYPICPEMHQMKCKVIHIRVVRCPFLFSSQTNIFIYVTVSLVNLGS